MEGDTRSLLVVAIEADLFETIAPVFRRARFYAELVPEPERALELLTVLPYNAVLLGLPLEDMAPERFLNTLRGSPSASRSAAVFILANSSTRAEADALVGLGANRVIVADEPDENLRRDVAAIVAAAPRTALRALTRLRIQLHLGPTVVLCQTENISATGMLIRTDHDFTVGTEVAFELSLPGEAKPIRGKAEVVRQTRQKREKVIGVGVRFRSLSPGDQERLTTHLGPVA
ncbi:MAG: PilZ domain-containing protein [Acidobacteriota bacterium]